MDIETFKTVVDSTPLISIDLLVENEKGEYLFGLRKNRPAKDYWFVPGGRVQKNETLDAAFRRLTQEELGVELERSHAQFKGVYEHFYQDSVFGEEVSTHYVVLAYVIKISSDIINFDESQHSKMIWHDLHNQEIKNIHPYTKAYFEGIEC
ncbi:MAG: GDP-mannose mannosyl hydrolase [Marinospirillum sp.]|nr:GDP-mannose mannosyl hydrolase [Marinospirillum sp.]